MRVSHTSHFVIKSFLFSSHSLDSKTPPRAYQWSSVSHSVCFLALITPPFVSATRFDLRRPLLKPWSLIGFKHHIPWPNPLLMTLSARKQTPFLRNVYFM